ncbi:MAG: Maf family protein [Eubacterium sp.]|nr:Maf family protein [Eubacterium sp.]
MEIILASQSPRREELLKRLGVDFKIITSSVDENIEEENAEALVEELSFRKSIAVMDRLVQEDGTKDYLVIGADTVVAVNDVVLGKPATKEEAFEMIDSIQGSSHFVFTGVTVNCYKNETGRIMRTSFVEGTQVTVFPMTEEEIWEYIDTGDCMDKAGAYGIQGEFGKFVEMIYGDYNNVVGLPLARLYQVIKGMIKE